MIAEGTNGLSRGDVGKGVMGQPMLDFVPLNLDPNTRSSIILDWVKSCWGLDPLTVLSLAGWYSHVHREGSFLWTSPPAATDATIKDLGKAQHKCPGCLHLVVVPHLRTGGRKQLTQYADLLLTLPLGADYWGTSHHEPLLFAICLLLSVHRPWKLRRIKFIACLDRDPWKLWTMNQECGWDLLHEFLSWQDSWMPCQTESGISLRKAGQGNRTSLRPKLLERLSWQSKSSQSSKEYP